MVLFVLLLKKLLTLCTPNTIVFENFAFIVIYFLHNCEKCRWKYNDSISMRDSTGMNLIKIAIRKRDE
jgi:hypothetical protein